MLSIVVAPSVHATAVRPGVVRADLPSTTYLPACRSRVWTGVAAVELGNACAAVATAEKVSAPFGPLHARSLEQQGSPLSPLAPAAPVAPVAPLPPESLADLAPRA